eukprot:SAG22_NODE_3671_length_1584_cov_1.618855_2_plen_152_part_00
MPACVPACLPACLPACTQAAAPGQDHRRAARCVLLSAAVDRPLLLLRSLLSAYSCLSNTRLSSGPALCKKLSCLACLGIFVTIAVLVFPDIIANVFNYIVNNFLDKIMAAGEAEADAVEADASADVNAAAAAASAAANSAMAAATGGSASG